MTIVIRRKKPHQLANEMKIDFRNHQVKFRFNIIFKKGYNDSFLFLCFLFIFIQFIHFLVIQIRIKPIQFSFSSQNHFSKFNYSAAVIVTQCSEQSPFNTFDLHIPNIIVSCNKSRKYQECREAGPMLNFIIDNYQQIPYKYLFFIHRHELSWHYPVPIFQRINSFLNSSCLEQVTFNAIINEHWNEGNSTEPTQNLYENIFKNTSMPVEKPITDNYFPCCATFAVKTELIWQRPLSDYLKIQANMNKYANASNLYYCSLLFEYSWHILFANITHVHYCNATTGRLE